MDASCLTRPSTKSDWIATTQRHITSKRSGDGKQCKDSANEPHCQTQNLRHVCISAFPSVGAQRTYSVLGGGGGHIIFVTPQAFLCTLPGLASSRACVRSSASSSVGVLRMYTRMGWWGQLQYRITSHTGSASKATRKPRSPDLATHLRENVPRSCDLCPCAPIVCCTAVAHGRTKCSLHSLPHSRACHAPGSGLGLTEPRASQPFLDLPPAPLPGASARRVLGGGGGAMAIKVVGTSGLTLVCRHASRLCVVSGGGCRQGEEVRRVLERKERSTAMAPAAHFCPAASAGKAHPTGRPASTAAPSAHQPKCRQRHPRGPAMSAHSPTNRSRPRPMLGTRAATDVDAH